MHQEFRHRVIIGFSIVFGSFLFFIITSYFLLSHVDAQKNKLIEAKSLIGRDATALSALAELRRDRARAEEYIVAIDKILVNEDELLEFPRWIDSISRGHRVSVSFSFTGEQVKSSGDDPGRIPFSISASGELEDLVSFLKDLEFKSPRFLISLDNFNVIREGLSYSLSSKGKVYFR